MVFLNTTVLLWDYSFLLPLWWCIFSFVDSEYRASWVMVSCYSVVKNGCAMKAGQATLEFRYEAFHSWVLLCPHIIVRHSLVRCLQILISFELDLFFFECSLKVKYVVRKHYEFLVPRDLLVFATSIFTCGLLIAIPIYWLRWEGKVSFLLVLSTSHHSTQGTQSGWHVQYVSRNSESRFQ